MQTEACGFSAVALTFCAVFLTIAQSNLEANLLECPLLERLAAVLDVLFLSVNYLSHYRTVDLRLCGNYLIILPQIDGPQQLLL